MNYSVVLPVLTGAAEREKGWRLRRNPKRAGEISEAAFVLRAHSLGFLVAKPWGDSEKYDFVLDAGSKLWRVQLKSTEVVHARGYEIQPIYSVYGKGKAGYTAEEIDALVVHIQRINLLRRISRSEEHTSELQSPCNLVCRLLLEKKKKR